MSVKKEVINASLGKVMYFDSKMKCIFSDFMMCIKPESPEVGKFIAYFLRSTLMKRVIKSIAVIGKGLQNVYPSQVELLQIPDPKMYDINKIVEDIDEEFEKNNNERNHVNDGLTRLEDLLNERLDFNKIME